MTSHNWTAEERLVQSLLKLGDDAEPTSEPHVDDETLAELAAGTLPDVERVRLVAHLADCGLCRTAASQLLYLLDDEPRATDDGPIAGAPLSVEDRPRWGFFLAAAALVLLAAGLLAFLADPDRQQAEATSYQRALALVEAGRFDEAEKTIESATAGGIESDRLRSLRSQAIREIPAAVALSEQGRLEDFGYEIGGVVARGRPPDNRLEAAARVLSSTGDGEVEAVLNRGHLFLSLGEYERARDEFRAAVGLAPENPLAWLGKGIAEFCLDDLEQAESSFRRAVHLDPANLDAQINLAMTLEEQGDTAEALAAWEGLLDEPLAAEDLAQIEQAIERLRQEEASR